MQCILLYLTISWYPKIYVITCKLFIDNKCLRQLDLFKANITAALHISSTSDTEPTDLGNRIVRCSSLVMIFLEWPTKEGCDWQEQNQQ